MRVCPWILAAACAADPLASDPAPPPPALAASAWVDTLPITLTATGLPPGADAWFVWSTEGPGVGPCPAPLGGACLGVRSPQLLGRATADAAGAAVLTTAAPPSGASQVWAQVATVGTASPVTGLSASAPPVWRPGPGTTWQWQLLGPIDTSFDVEMYDVDLFDVPIATIDALHADGRTVVCYLSAGSWEDWRPDAGAFPAAVRGARLAGWPGERWLDVRSPVVRQRMQARLDLAAQKGCDGVEPDNVDGWANRTGFPLTAADQLDYNRFLASEAHARGLSIGLKNDVAQLPALVGWFDWALNEECLAYRECGRYRPFLDAGKAVFHVEYPSGGDLDALAAQVCPLGLPLETLIKPMDLTPPRIACADWP